MDIRRRKASCELPSYEWMQRRSKLVLPDNPWLPGVFHCPINTATKVHITGKPLALVQELMEIVKPGGTILAPFLGGGTTAHAAMLTGRKCIGVELSPGYAQLSADRLLNIN